MNKPAAFITILILLIIIIIIRNSLPGSYLQDDCIQITEFHFNAEGDDNYNLNDEYINFINRCSYDIDMTAWTIEDTSNHIYTFPPFILKGKQEFTLYIGTGINTDSALYWGRTPEAYAAVWTNTGDSLFLRDINDKFVLIESYEGFE